MNSRLLNMYKPQYLQTTASLKISIDFIFVLKKVPYNQVFVKNTNSKYPFIYKIGPYLLKTVNSPYLPMAKILFDELKNV